MHYPWDAHIFGYATLLQVFCASVPSRPGPAGLVAGQIGGLVVVAPGFSSVARAQREAAETAALSLPPAAPPFRLLPCRRLRRAGYTAFGWWVTEQTMDGS